MGERWVCYRSLPACHYESSLKGYTVERWSGSIHLGRTAALGQVRTLACSAHRNCDHPVASQGEHPKLVQPSAKLREDAQAQAGAGDSSQRPGILTYQFCCPLKLWAPSVLCHVVCGAQESSRTSRYLSQCPPRVYQRVQKSHQDPVSRKERGQWDAWEPGKQVPSHRANSESDHWKTRPRH